MTSLVADSALSRAANRRQLAQTHLPWITRVPATLSPAQAVLAQATPQILASLTAGSRDDELPSIGQRLTIEGVMRTRVIPGRLIDGERFAAVCEVEVMGIRLTSP